MRNFIFFKGIYEDSVLVKQLSGTAEQLCSDVNANGESLIIAKGLMGTEETVDVDDADLKKLKGLFY